MSDIGGLGNPGNDPFASVAQRQQQSDGLLEQQRAAQERAAERAREAQGLEPRGGRSPAEREGDEIRQDAGPGVRRDALARTDGSPKFRRLSDETAAIDSVAERPRPPGQDEVRLSREAQQRLAGENDAPPPGEAPVQPEPDDPLTIDTAQEQQRIELATPINRGQNESQAARPLGRILDQFS